MSLRPKYLLLEYNSYFVHVKLVIDEARSWDLALFWLVHLIRDLFDPARTS